MAVGLPEGPSYPGHSPSFFRSATHRMTAEGQHTASLKLKKRSTRLFFLSLFSCPSLDHLRLLILLLLLMSGNVHPNPRLIFPCSLCAGNLTWQGKSVQCCICSKWIHLRCSQLSLSEFKTLGRYHSWSFPPCCVPTRNTVTLCSYSSDLYTSTAQSSPLG